MTDDKQEQVFRDVSEKYKSLAPNVHTADLQEAMDICYKEGMTAEELTKKTYSFLYPVREPLLY